ncbi:MAG: GDYXXLXY domain-containing protein [Betaproteobacteria bacterium]|nr:GDYXXLXY domain-containing protein [Betaproteobacteria bacterium]
MSAGRLDAVVRAAIAEGILPVTATRPELEHRPWPVVLLIGLGAWLAAIPLLIAVGLLLGDFISRGPGPYVVGALFLAGAIVVFRAQSLPVFVEQLALPALLVGGGALGFALYRDVAMQGASATLAVIACVVAASIDRAWLRVLLGAAAAGFATLAFVSKGALNLNAGALPQFFIAWHATLMLWVIAQAVRRNALEREGSIALAAAVESIAAGWLLVTLAGLAWLSGMTFLAGASLQPNIALDIAREVIARETGGARLHALQQATSVALAAGGLWWGARNWPSLRRPWCAGVAAVLLLLAWFMSTLGAVLLALSICLVAQRWLQAGAACVAAAWIIGAFYYQSRYPLAEKALLLVAAGAALGALAWLAIREASGAGTADLPADPAATAAAPDPNSLLQWGGIALALVLTLGVANVGIWQKEDVIARGQPVFVELAPVDPRSLMQGDYMRLDFRLPGDIAGADERLLSLARPRVIARRDARGVAVLLRIETAAAALAPDEIGIELTPKNGRWILVTDAWFFREGDAERWSKARYGEFRVAPDGRALLVGVADRALQPIRP